MTLVYFNSMGRTNNRQKLTQTTQQKNRRTHNLDWIALGVNVPRLWTPTWKLIQIHFQCGGPVSRCIHLYWYMHIYSYIYIAATCAAHNYGTCALIAKKRSGRPGRETKRRMDRHRHRHRHISSTGPHWGISLSGKYVHIYGQDILNIHLIRYS